MAIDPVAFKNHAFEYDPAALDAPLVELLQRFYTFSDSRENAPDWAACFTENGVMKKASTNVTGREAIAKVNEGSWIGQASRQHIVFKVYAFNPGCPDEVMLYGLSKYVYENGSTGEMGWAAKIHLNRSADGSVLIDEYHIYPAAPPKASA